MWTPKVANPKIAQAARSSVNALFQNGPLDEVDDDDEGKAEEVGG